MPVDDCRSCDNITQSTERVLRHASVTCLTRGLLVDHLKSGGDDVILALSFPLSKEASQARCQLEQLAAAFHEAANAYKCSPHVRMRPGVN